MLRYRRRAPDADVRHFQWLPVERIDAHLLPAARPRVLTMHNVIRREVVDRRLAAKMDAVIVHTRHGADLLGGDRVHVIPHGAFEHLTRQRDEQPLPPELAAVEGPVVLYFGLVRPYKGVDVLVDAFRQVEGAELWVVGRPLEVSIEHLRLRAPERVRFVDRHLSVDVSGVLFAGLAFGKAMVLSDVGGFREIVEEHGAGRPVPPGDPDALAAAIGELLADPGARAELERHAAAAASGPYSWDRVAEATQRVYEEVSA
jgi:glycosyltransferase involved in cell wall biosynthesis